MKNCKHYDICGLKADADPEAGLCILHSKDPKKDKKAFVKKLEEHRKNRRDCFRFFVFPEKVGFNDATFTKEADFKGATFTKEADFNNATFTKEANFNGATFAEQAGFYGAKFAEGVDFSGAKFAAKAYFSDATFTKEVGFMGAIFNKEADFMKAKFTEGAFFFDAKFVKEAKFYETTFAKEAKFTVATFAKKAGFNGAKFTEEVDFRNATFAKEAIFIGAAFIEDAHFSNATFTKEADFSVATFAKEANFYKAKFSEETDFIGTTFTKGANFARTLFKKGVVDFRYSRFFDRTLFVGFKEKKKKTTNIFQGIKVDFRNVDVTPPDAIIFRDADLSRCLLQGTRVDKIEFTGVKWNKISGKLGYSRVGIYDAKVLLESDKGKKNKEMDWEHVERVYRDLKKNHEENRDYERAGDFHYGEKEMRRRNPNTPGFHRFILHLYRLISGYGERYIRPLVWALVLLIACTIGYMALGIGPKGIETKSIETKGMETKSMESKDVETKDVETKEGVRLLKITSIKDWITVGLYSLQVMMLLRPTELQPIGVASSGLKVFQSIAGPIIIGLFALAIRQRMKR
jgi:uncharacterized protein YjbI with pentapeptide repeats